MRDHSPYSFYVRNAVVAIKQQLDKYPLKYKTCSELIEQTTTVNRRILEKAFRYEYGFRIKEYQVRQRLVVAKMYLLDGMPLKRVAAKCLYSSQSAFCRAFKKAYSMTPTDWLRK